MHQETANRNILFAGELDDPWVGLIVTSISSVVPVRTVDVRGPMPERLTGDDEYPRSVIIHRLRLSLADVCRIEAYRQTHRSKLRPEMILCYSPYVRYAELERCAQAVDLLIPEASAVDVLPCHLSRDVEPKEATPDHPQRRLIQVDVVSTDHALRTTLQEICLAAGFGKPEGSDTAFTAHSLHSCGVRSGAALLSDMRPHPVVTVWDVPVLDAGWPELIEHRSRLGPVIALLGFADRAMVGLARSRGAAACLELPFNVADLIDVLDRVSRPMLAERDAPGPDPRESHQAVPAPHVSRMGKVRGRHRSIGAHPPSLRAPGPNQARQPADPEAGSRPGAVARRRNDV
jgi:FixJ family two-component response regulator